MKLPATFAVTVQDYRVPTRVCVSWDAGDVRYHFWLHTETWEVENNDSRPTIYKNPLNTDSRSEGYFRTRYLRADNGSNAAVVADMIETIKSGTMVENAIAEAKKREAREDARRHAEAIEYVSKRVRDDLAWLKENAPQAFMDVIKGEGS
jgi:hypothetical protein